MKAVCKTIIALVPAGSTSVHVVYLLDVFKSQLQEWNQSTLKGTQAKQPQQYIDCNNALSADLEVSWSCRAKVNKKKDIVKGGFEKAHLRKKI